MFLLFLRALQSFTVKSYSNFDCMPCAFNHGNKNPWFNFVTLTFVLFVLIPAFEGLFNDPVMVSRNS